MRKEYHEKRMRKRENSDVNPLSVITDAVGA
jgi:hypothetical protein